MKTILILILLFGVSTKSFAEYFEDQNYGEHLNQTYDLSTGQSSSLLVLVHGGGWIGGDKQDQNFDYGDSLIYLSERYGLNVASINYTLATLENPSASGPTPMPVHDIYLAIMHIQESIGASRVVVLGTSAGANLAAMSYLNHPAVIDGFIGFYGAYDLTRYGDFNQEVETMIGTYTGNRVSYELYSSPVNHIFPKTNFLLYHGSEDTVIDPVQSALMHQVHGGEFYLVDNAEHSFNVFGEEWDPAPWMERIIRYVYAE